MQKKSSIKFTLLVLFLGLNSYISAQNNNKGTPFFQDYSNTENPIQNQSLWEISQNSDGTMFFGGNKYLTTYDGTNWGKTKTNEISSMVYSSKEDRMYIGTRNNFGYMQMQNNGKFQYINLSDKIKNINVKTTWRVLSTNNGIYFFINKNKIINYNNDILTVLKTPENFEPTRGFHVLNNVYAVDDKGGICLIDNKNLILLPNTQEIAKQSIRDMIAISQNEILIATNKNGLYLFDINNNKIDKIITQADSYLTEHELYRAIKIENGFAFSTISGGIVVLYENMKINYILNRNSGLPTNTVYTLFVDKDKNLWLGTSKGAILIYTSSILNFFSEKSGILGNIFSFKILENKILIGTNEGLFSKNNDETKFKAIHNKGYIYYFEEITNPANNKKEILSSSIRNTFTLDNENNKKIITPIYSVIASLKFAENSFFHGHYAGGSFFEFEFVNNEYKIRKRYNIKKYNFLVMSACLDNKNNLWLASLSNGIAFLNLNNIDTNELIPIRIDTLSSGLPSNNENYVYFTNNKLFVASPKGLYEIDNNNIKNYTFKPSTDFGLNYKKDSIIVYYLKTDKNKNTWLATSEGLKKYDSQKQELISLPFKTAIGNFELTKIYFEEPNTVWFSTKGALYRFEDKDNFNKTNLQHNILIRKITLKDNNILNINKNADLNSYCFENDSIIKLNNKLTYKDNYIKIEYTLPFYEKSKNTTYSTQLIGFDKEWSPWTKNSEILYKNLPAGKYKFKVKAKNTYGEISNTITIIFSIQPPWYKTIYAFFIYLTFFFLVIILFLKRIKNEKEKFERIVKRRTEKVEQQKKEIEDHTKKLKLNQIELETKTRNLELLNKEQKRLSVVAKLTNDSVLILDEQGHFEWWNHGFTELFYYRYEKYKNSSFKIKQQKLRPDITKAIKNYSRDKGRISYTSHETFENGEEIWFQTTINPVLDDNGFIYRFVVIDINMTDIKLSERKIREQRTNLLDYKKQLDYLKKENTWQNKIIEEGYKSMDASIQYANKIQNVFLPFKNEIDKIFPKNFVLNNPKDIISGDFYWLEKTENKTIIAVADSTGHGIPGGFMTTFGISLLKEIIYKAEKLEANIILNNLREQTIFNFNKITNSKKNIDNIDISLCIIDHKKGELQYAGSNQPIITIINKELTTWKPDRIPINGNHKKGTSFKNNKIKIKSGDKIYLFTDGYHDQFGGLMNNKFYIGKFKKLIFSIHEKEMQKQKNILINEFYKWKGENFRVDDILIVGLTIP